MWMFALTELSTCDALQADVQGTPDLETSARRGSRARESGSRHRARRAAHGADNCTGASCAGAAVAAEGAAVNDPLPPFKPE